MVMLCFRAHITYFDCSSNQIHDMSRLHFLICLFVLPFVLQGQDAWLADPLESLYPDSNRIRLHHRYAADFPLNGFAEAVLLVKSDLVRARMMNHEANDDVPVG